MPESPQDLHPKFAAALNAGDLDALAALYELNAVLLPAPGQAARGAAEIRTALAGLLASKPTIELDTAAVFEMPEGIALLHGKWRLKGIGPDGSTFESSGTSSEVARRQPDGRWLYVVDNPYGG